MEVASFGVRVSVVQPGFFKTGIEQRARDQAVTRAAVDDSPYRRAYGRVQSTTDLISSVAPPPGMVARTIVGAVESRRPRHRYLVGADAIGIAVANPLVPRQVTDTVARLVADLRQP
jgi:NAD(P)-dependent dehydrogenase (short-subunit alcohol dehydrogenase family)